MRQRHKVIALAVLSPMLAIAVYLALVAVQARGGLPDYDAEIPADDLDRPVRIVRDANGVPHIIAESDADAQFALGFLHAQDRLWQMALQKRLNGGRLSEWFGERALEQDRKTHAYGYVTHLDAQWRAFPAEEKPLVEAYARGVNAYLQSKAYRRPPEMRILHVHPEPWRPQDSLVVNKQFYRGIAREGDPAHETISRHVRMAARTPYAIDAIEGYAANTPPIIDPAPGETVTSFEPWRTQPSFSDNWTLSGEHVASGLPLMANDPQLPSTMPNVWYLVHISTPDYSAVGGSVPGIPGVVAGRNEDIAWGVTAGGIDLVDANIIQVDLDGEKRFRDSPDAPWRPLQVRRETVKVRFKGDVDLEFYDTPDGVVVPGDFLSRPVSDNPADHLQVRQLITHKEDNGVAGILRNNKSRSVEDGMKAIELITSPTLNMSFADRRGAIGYKMAGLIPLRPAENAATLDYASKDPIAWTGLLSPSENPSVLNPASGRIVSANQRMIGDNYPHYLTTLWLAPTRALRVHELLDTQAKHDRESFLTMQQDVHSLRAERLAPVMLSMAQTEDPKDAAVLAELAEWDFRFDLDATGPLIFTTWAILLNKALIQDELGDAFSHFSSPTLAGLEGILTGDRRQWCNDIDTEEIEDCAQMARKALRETRLALEAHYGGNPAKWTWGRALNGYMPHVGFAGLPVLDKVFSRRTPFPGGIETLFRNGVSIGDAPVFEGMAWSSSYQGIYDMSEPDESLFIISGGQSGHFRSPHYDDLRNIWLKGGRITIPTDLSLVEPAHEMMLLPTDG